MIVFSDCSNGHSPSLSDGPSAQTRHHPQRHCRQKLLVSFIHRQQIELDKAIHHLNRSPLEHCLWVLQEKRVSEPGVNLIKRRPLVGIRYYATNDSLSQMSSFCCQVAVLVADTFYNFYFVKNRKISNNSATTEAREKWAHFWNP